ncbi:MAG: hypothetical protein JXB32_21775 [Deltaproteobacteria bacterium]|nr:hypothetical protein [Deltaproteobacteria bacterium]
MDDPESRAPVAARRVVRRAWSGRQPWRRHLPAACALLALQLSLSLWWSPSTAAYPIDDPYVHLVYARSLAHGDPLAFNPGEPSLGTSSPAWMTALAGLLLVTDDPLAAVHVLVALLFVAWAFAVYLLVEAELCGGAASRTGLRRGAAMLCGAAVLASGQTQWMAAAGMETPLEGLLLFLAAWAHGTRGPGRTSALLLAAALWTRITAALMLLAAGLREAAAGGWARRATWRWAALATLPFLPWIATSLLVGGSVLPTTAGGKTATFVPGDPDPAAAAEFVLHYLRFLRHTPVLRLLVPLLLLFGLWQFGRLVAAGLRRRRVSLSPAELLGLWSVLHLGLFALTFRSFLHYGRYLLPLSAAALAVAAVLAFRVVDRRLGPRGAWLPVVLLAAAVLLQAAGLPAWRRLYRRDVDHVARVHVAAARWVRDHTPPDAVVAAYDIGALGWLGGRRVVDLFGLLDPASHPYLERRAAAEYLRRSGAAWVLHLQDPNADFHTRLYRAEYDGPELLDLRFRAAFRAPPYDQPTVSQSFGIEIHELLGWHPVTPAGRRAQFTIVRTELPPGLRDPPVDFPGGARFLGCELLLPRVGETLVLQRVLFVPTLGFRATCYWQPLEPAAHPPVWRLLLAPAGGGAPPRVVVESHALAYGLLEGPWRPDEPAREPLTVWLPPELPPGPYELRVEVLGPDGRTPRAPLGTDGSGEPGTLVAPVRVLPRTRDEL